MIGDAGAWLLGALACWRLTHLLWAEDGPGQSLARWRARLPVSPHNGLPAVVGCFYCLSLWLALPISALVLALAGAPDGPAQWLGALLLGSLGLSGATILIERALDRPPLTLSLPPFDVMPMSAELNADLNGELNSGLSSVDNSGTAGHSGANVNANPNSNADANTGERK